jgi:hypothetical protein
VTGHAFVRPGQVAADRPAPDACVECGEPEAVHANGSLRNVAVRLDAMTAVLGPALATWAARDDARPQPGVRQTANTAMAAIDDMLTALHRARQQLVSEIRVSDDANMARADELLAAARAEHEADR